MYWEGIILAAVVIVLFFILYKLLKNSDDSKINNISTGLDIVNLGSNVLTEILRAIDKNPEKKSIVEKLADYANIAVDSIRQTFGTIKEFKENNPEFELADIKEMMKENAKKAVYDMAAKDEIELTEKDDALISTLIEAEVFALNLIFRGETGDNQTDTPDTE